MSQPSLFSAETLPPDITDLGGLLAAHGQITAGPGGARLSILVADQWRATALVGECADRGIDAEAVEAGEGASATLVRTARTEVLTALAGAWTRGAVKAVPQSLTAAAGLLRLWAIAAGRATPAGYALGLDPHAPDTHRPLAAVCARAGLAGTVAGMASDTPAIRLTGRKKVARLFDTVGFAPPGAPAGSWPVHSR